MVQGSAEHTKKNDLNADSLLERLSSTSLMSFAISSKQGLSLHLSTPGKPDINVAQQ